MRRAVLAVMLFVTAASFFVTPSYAVGDSAEGYLDELYDILGTDESFTDSIGVEALLSELLSAISENGGRAAGFAAYILGGVILISLASLITDRRGARSAVAALVVIGAYGQIYSLAAGAVESLEKMSKTFFSLIPIMSGVTLGGGGVSSAGAEAVAMGTVFGTVSGVFTPLLLPLCSAMLALSVGTALGCAEIGAIFSRVRSFFLWLLGIVTSLLLGCVALQGVICAAKDSAAMRVAKFSASGLLPVVGGTVSASLASLASGLSYAKSIIGAQAIYVIFTVAVSPILLMLIYRLTVSMACGLLSFLGSDGGGGALSNLTFSLDAILSVYLVSTILYTFEILMFMKSGVAIL